MHRWNYTWQSKTRLASTMFQAAAIWVIGHFTLVSRSAQAHGSDNGESMQVKLYR